MASRTFAHLIGSLSGAVLVAVCLLDPYHWLPMRNVWAAIIVGALLALTGSLYAARKGSRWWFVLTATSLLVILLDIIALGG